MAEPSNITNVARRRVTELIEELYRVDPLLFLIEDVAADDPARIAFYQQYLGTDQNPTTDITATQFFAAVLALRDLRTWLVTNRPILAKLRV